MDNMIYLDYNATTPLSENVKRAIIDSLNEWANPSSASIIGARARSLIDNARSQISNLINCEEPKNIIFESGGTEVNNHVIYSCIQDYKGEGLPHIITSNIEHDATLKPLLYLQKSGKCEVTFVPVDLTTGAVSVQNIVEALKPNTCLVTLMLANNETGVLQPVKEVAQAVSSMNNGSVVVHTDAAQTIGKINVDVQDLGVHMMTIVGHKFYGPRIGALYVRSLGKDTILHPLLFGGGQEQSFRSGTENTPMIVGLGAAAQESLHYITPEKIQQMQEIKNIMIKHLKVALEDVIMNFETSTTLPNTLSLCLKNLCQPSSNLVSACAQQNLIISGGAACHSSSIKPSRVLTSSGMSEFNSLRTVRISLGRDTTHKDIVNAVTIMKKAYLSLQMP